MSLALIAGSAYAQEQVPTSSPLSEAPVAFQEQEAPDEAAGVSNIVVTGSRLVRDGSQAPTPVTVVSAESLAQSAPSSIPDALNKLPVFSGSQSQSTTTTFSATQPAMGNYLNLRNLGTNRVLVLLDGNRVPPTSNTNAVDVNVLPQLLISRVDVVTGGASAAYGSDAVSGVVNFVLDQKFTGLKSVLQAGISDKGDAFSYRYGAAVGIPVGESIHLLASYEHFNNDGVDNLFKRSWAPYSPITGGNGTVGSPFRPIPNGRSADLAYGGLVTGVSPGTLAPLSACGPTVVNCVQFGPDGSLVPFLSGSPIVGNQMSGGSGGVWGRADTTPISGRLKTDQAFARVTVDLSDSVEAYVQGVFAHSATAGNTTVESHRGGNRLTTIYRDNAFLDPAVAALLPATTANGMPGSFTLGRLFDDIPLMTQRSTTTFYMGQAAIKGDLTGSWKWDVNYVAGRSKLRVAANEFDSRRFFAAVDAVRDPSTGRVVCGVLLRSPTFANQAGLSNCVPMNVLGEGNISKESFDFVRQNSVSSVVSEMQYVNANVHGDLFDLPAGPVSLAFGVEYRTQKLRQTTNAQPDIFAGLSGSEGEARKIAYFGLGNITTPTDDLIRGVPANPLPFLVTNVGTASGRQTVKEAYAELLVPLLKEQPFAESLELNLAGRYTHYRTSGGEKTWKIGATWSPIRDLRFRGTFSRDIAAPSLFNLFAGANIATTNVTDPFLPSPGNSYSLLINTAGNPNLKPEKANTLVLGMVLTPQAIPGLTISADAYRIKIKDAFQGTNAVGILADCFNNRTAQVCDQIIRPAPDARATQINLYTLNLASLTTKGVDLEIGYRTSLDALLPSVGGDLSLRAFINYLDAYDTEASGAPVVHRAGRIQGVIGAGAGEVGRGGLPKWRGTLTQEYIRGPFSISFAERFTGTYKRFLATQVVHPEMLPLIKAPNRTYVDMNVQYEVRTGIQAFVNVQNLFDVNPPVFQPAFATNIETPTDKQLYDVIGRYFTAGVRVKF
ncbi:TonB-dependent receptor plug domain-containing protein [Sphingobium sp. EP60837]|uniref:TonB-dependent receptor plug domain-containing protein n=1 Tax=Sphingobium sp. EP60837 TaxID=1855519 RepID=UPI000833C88B|nr:TonB-dependent receptor [Sphingobium sp. EP60837]